jgi:energy-coupling factor transporter ATP-binding protein EcfA2
MIEICDLSFSYPGAIKPVLRGVSLQVPEGELCLVIGPSGSGKSDFARCIIVWCHTLAGSLWPHSGGGFDPVRLSPRR